MAKARKSVKATSKSKAKAPARPDIGQMAMQACVLEVLAPKPGNVTVTDSFSDASWPQFAVSAMVTRPIFAEAAKRGIGQTVLDAVRVTQEAVGHNTNLGIVLLLAPLAAVPVGVNLATGVSAVLRDMTPTDTVLVYEAIRLAKPTGLGSVPEADVNDLATTPLSLLAAMSRAADRDRVARQYVSDFDDVLNVMTPRLLELHHKGGLTLDDAIVLLHVECLARWGDSLVTRKCGALIDATVREKAREVLDAGGPEDVAYHRSLSDLDAYLRADGHKRNPGSTADLIAATLFVAIRDFELASPWTWTPNMAW